MPSETKAKPRKPPSPERTYVLTDHVVGQLISAAEHHTEWLALMGDQVQDPELTKRAQNLGDIAGILRGKLEAANAKAPVVLITNGAE